MNIKSLVEKSGFVVSDDAGSLKISGSVDNVEKLIELVREMDYLEMQSSRPKLEIDDLDYVKELRQAVGWYSDDISLDHKIVSMTPMQRVQYLSQWFYGDHIHAMKFKQYFESQGLWLTVNPDADGVIHD